MGNHIFGVPKKQEPSPIKTAPSLQEQIQILEKRITHLNNLIQIHVQKAKEAKTKDEAYRYLKLKQMYETELKGIFGMLDRLEGLDNARHRAILHNTTLNVTENATSILKSITVNPDKADEIMFDVKEAIDEVDRTSEILGKTDPPSQELQDELNVLMAPEAPPAIITLPDVPARVENTADKELRMLVAS